MSTACFLPSRLHFAAVTWIIFVAAGLVRGENPAARPNLLVLVADDMAHADLGCAGHPLLKTPNLDRLAAGGVRFTHAFTPNPICTPSRAAILTGQDCWTNGCYFFNMPIRETSVQFAQLLSQAGYLTFYTGKWHNDGKPWDHGYVETSHVIMGGCPAARGGHEHPWVFDHRAEKPRQVDRFSSTLVTDAAVEFLDRLPTGKEAASAPFLMYVSYAAPHDPWTPPGDYAGMYPPQSIPLPPNFRPQPGYRWFTEWHGTQLRDEALMPFPRTPEGVRDVRSRYFGMTSQMDHQLGRILDKLDERGLAKNTLVLFIADHGISLGAHGFSGKQTMYEEGIRLPMIVRWPKFKRGPAVRSELVSLIDVFPTLCQAAGVKVSPAIEGISLLDLYQGQADWPRERIYAAFHSPQQHRMVSRAVRTERHKLIHNLLTDEVELYDLRDDPFELKNLADDSDYAILRRELAADLLAWRQRSEPP